MKNTRLLLILAAAMLSLASCKLNCDCGSAVPPEQYDKVMILYSVGKNSLSADLKSDINDLCTGYIPGMCSGDALVVVSHLNEPRCSPGPIIESLYIDLHGALVRDTLQVLDPDSRLTDKSTMRMTLQTIDRKFKASHYGMIYSSHATGWLPAGRYNGTSQSSIASASALPAGAVPYVEPVLQEGEPRVKSVGQTRVGTLSYEMELSDFADAIPFHLDYLLFDACLMGGIETAYQLREHCSLLGFSQAEILAEGLNYKTMGERLLKGAEPDVRGVCDDYFKYYDSQTGSMRSATISLVDCTQLEPLADICKSLYKTYSTQLSKLSKNDVQRYFRYDKKWYFDLQDMLEKCGLTKSESDALQQALDVCVIYKGATPSFLLDYSGFSITNHCGLSCYMPSEGSDSLNDSYASLDWNKRTELVHFSL